MAITKDANVQAVVSKTVTINLADVTTGVDIEAMDLPPNSVIQSGSLYTTEAWNSTTSDVLDVGDSVTQNRYLNDGNIRALGAVVALVPTGYVSAGKPILVTPVFADAVTVGSLRLQVQYIIGGRANEAQP